MRNIFDEDGRLYQEIISQKNNFLPLEPHQITCIDTQFWKNSQKFFSIFFQKIFLAEAMQDEESFIRVSEIDESDDVKRSQTIEAAVAKVKNQIFIFLKIFYLATN